MDARKRPRCPCREFQLQRLQGRSAQADAFARLVRRFSGSGGWHATCSGILGLTKMDWNNNTLYKKLPVTLVYSKAFADIIQQNQHLTDDVFDFRNFM